MDGEGLTAAVASGIGVFVLLALCGWAVRRARRRDDERGPD